jgi:hypothetical protein
MSSDPTTAAGILARAQAWAHGRRRRLVLEGESIEGVEYRVAADRLLGRGLEPEELAAILMEVERRSHIAPPAAPAPPPPRNFSKRGRRPPRR